MSESYWEARARILAERRAEDEEAVEPEAPASKRTRKPRAEVEPPPAAETPGDPGLTKE